MQTLLRLLEQVGVPSTKYVLENKLASSKLPEVRNYARPTHSLTDGREV